MCQCTESEHRSPVLQTGTSTRMGGDNVAAHLYGIVDEYSDGDDDRLANLEAIHTSQDIDRVGAEYCKARHEEIVAKTHLQRRTQQGCEHAWQHDDGATAIDSIDYEKR